MALENLFLRCIASTILTNANPMPTAIAVPARGGFPSIESVMPNPIDSMLRAISVIFLSLVLKLSHFSIFFERISISKESISFILFAYSSLLI